MMRHSTILMRLAALFVVVLFGVGCNGEVAPRSAIPITDLKLKLPDSPDTTACKLPKPADIGCTTICKPCKTFVCQNGEWEPHDVEPPEFVCDSSRGSNGQDISACPRSSTGFCPAECSLCF